MTLMSIERRQILKVFGAVCGYAALAPFAGRALHAPPDEWYYDATTGLWKNDGASLRILRAAARKAGIRVRVASYPNRPAVPTTTEWGFGWFADDLSSVEAQMTHRIAEILSRVSVWYEAPHVRQIKRVPYSRTPGIIAFYGVSAGYLS